MLASSCWNQWVLLSAGGNEEGEGMPPLNLWGVKEDGELRNQVVYGEAEQAAHTLHFESSENVRLFGSTAFIYFPSRSWQARIRPLLYTKWMHSLRYGPTLVWA